MSDDSTGVANRGLITASIMLAAVMITLDTTIANVALPHMAGSVSASADQITWVLTSYIIASAIFTPLTGWFTGRFGSKMVFMASIIGFTIASALCGAATSLSQVVIFRFLQGAIGAAVVPLSQAVLMEIYPPERQAHAIALWGMGTMIGPIIGPALGGWLTENANWRWVFYINVPFGIASAIGVWSFIKSGRLPAKVRFDFSGFALLSLGVGSLQLMLDRGTNNAWLESTETWIELTVAGVALALFAIHTFLVDQPFLPVALIKDPNFLSASGFGFIMGMLMFSTLSLIPPMLETLLGYPVAVTGLLTAPRGIGTLVSMLIVGQFIGRIDSRLIAAFGITMASISVLFMSRYSIDMDGRMVGWLALSQGLGLGLVFVPLTTLGFLTLAPRLRPDAAAVFTLLRNLGGSVGISIMQSLLSHNSQVVHARLTEGIRLDNPLANAHLLRAPFSLSNPSGLAALEGEIGRQAAMVAYVDDFKMIFFMGMAAVPLLLFMRTRGGGGTSAPHAAIE